jgi:hypothetical protein
MSGHDHPGEEELFGTPADEARVREIDQETLVEKWRAEQLVRLGVPTRIASAAANGVDWHQVANLVARGASPILAVEIAR